LIYKELAINMTYQTYQWSELNEAMKGTVINSYAASWNVEENRRADMYRIFDLGNPAIIFDSIGKYCRINTDSVNIMKPLVRTYF